jgi:hypothetical protein
MKNDFYIKALKYDLDKLKLENLELKNQIYKLQKTKELLLYEIGISEEDFDNE